jgi:hypothetical protein
MLVSSLKRLIRLGTAMRNLPEEFDQLDPVQCWVVFFPKSVFRKPSMRYLFFK